MPKKLSDQAVTNAWHGNKKPKFIGYEVRINVLTPDCKLLLDTPEHTKEAVAKSLEADVVHLQEEVDFTIDVAKVYR